MPDDLKPETPAPKADAPDLAKENESLKARLAEMEAKYSAPKADDSDLNDKVRMKREEEERKSGDTREIEEALKFSLSAKQFVSENQSLLPQEVAGIFDQAEKENYASAIEKDRAIKDGIIQSFFKLQANVDLLTPGLKSTLDEYLKLTKTGKQEKAKQVFSTVFEPAFEMLRRIKRAESVSKGHGAQTDVQTAYLERLKKQSAKHYRIGENSK